MRAVRLRVDACPECGAHDYANAFCPTCHANSPSGCMSMHGPANFLGMGQSCPVCRPATESDRRRVVTCESCRGSGRCSSCDGLGRREIIDRE